MQPTRRMLLNDKMVASAPPLASARLGSDTELPLLSVDFKRHGASTRALELVVICKNASILSTMPWQNSQYYVG
jgi:hypothetical protein